MNTTALWHLTWKEYRAVRPFWLSMVGLILLLQAMIGFFSTEPNWTLLALCNLALAGPAFFAVGAAGTAFAIEHEDGTYDFLRSVPVSSREILVSKVGLAVLATLAMLLVLVPLTMLWTDLKLPVKVTPAELAGLWVMASLEAIAWGTLFSLLLKRPLPAVCLALVATSTAAHTLAGMEIEGRVIEFQLASYTAALGWRVALTAAVLAVDVVLGLRWLRTTGDAAVRPLMGARNRETATPTKWSVAPREQAKQLVARPDRFNIVNRLSWQHVRQSWRTMLLMAGLQIFVSFVAFQMGLSNGNQEYVLLPLAGFAALMGSSAFLADQERRNFRFFVEHNVPARYVWFTRNAAWIGLLIMTTTFICIGWMLPAVSQIQAALTERFNWYRTLEFPPIARGLAWVAIGYAAGQWSSMHIRSGLLAGFVGLVLCVVLCYWAYLIELLGEGWLFFILPIPLVLMAATWLRAPDWIREMTTTRARLRAAGAVLAPAACLLVLLPVTRVTGVPKQIVPVDVAAYEAEVTPAGLETAALYRRASEIFSEQGLDYEGFVEKNKECIDLLLEASQRPDCFLIDFQQNPDPVVLRHADQLWMLMTASADQLEKEGKLDEALQRYFDTLNCISHWAQHGPIVDRDRKQPYTNARRRKLSYEWPPRHSGHVFSRFSYWAAHYEQTPQRIATAIQRLAALDASVLHLEDGIKSNYLLGQLLLNDPLATSWRIGPNEEFTPATMIALRFMPWEYQRERRLLDGATQSGLLLLSSANSGLANDWPLGKYPVRLKTSLEHVRFPLNLEADIREMNDYAIRTLGDFETDRRATILALAVQQYRLTHGVSPANLNDLVPSILPRLPVDPYSGVAFRYTPEKPDSTSDGEIAWASIWGTGPDLRAVLSKAFVTDGPTPDNVLVSPVDHYESYAEGFNGHGHWYLQTDFERFGRTFFIPPVTAKLEAAQ